MFPARLETRSESMLARFTESPFGQFLADPLPCSGIMYSLGASVFNGSPFDH